MEANVGEVVTAPASETAEAMGVTDNQQTVANSGTVDQSLLSGAQDKDGSGEHEHDLKAAPAEQLVELKDIKTPEGTERNEEMGKAFLDIVNDSKLSRGELAQKLVDMYVNTQTKFLEAQKAAAEAQRQQDEEFIKKEDEEWIKAARNHPEYGGVNWEASQAYIAKGRDYLATPGLIQLLEENRLGNNPELLLMFYRAGKLFSEDRALKGEGKAPAVNLADLHWGKITEQYFRDKGVE